MQAHYMSCYSSVIIIMLHFYIKVSWCRYWPKDHCSYWNYLATVLCS